MTFCIILSVSGLHKVFESLSKPLVPVCVSSPAEPGGAGGAGLQGGFGPAGAPDPAAPTPPALSLPPPQRHVPDPGGRGGRVLQRLGRQHPPPSAGHGAGVPQETGRGRYNTASPPRSEKTDISLTTSFLSVCHEHGCPEPNHRIGTLRTTAEPA